LAGPDDASGLLDQSLRAGRFFLPFLSLPGSSPAVNQPAVMPAFADHGPDEAGMTCLLCRTRAATARDRIAERAHDQDPDGNRQLRTPRCRGRPLLGRPDAALAAQFPHRGRTHAGAAGAGAGHRQEGRRARQHGARVARGEARRGHRRRRPGGRRRQARRPFPARRVADRVGHPDQHERQRGDRQPGHRDARRQDGLQAAGPPQRPRQPLPIVQRRVPHRHAHRRRRRGQPIAAAGARPPRQRRWRRRQRRGTASSRSAAPTPRTPRR
jgi:hypothetical protein